MLSIVLWPLSNIPLLMSLIACAYAFRFGILETLRGPFRVPSLAWQVPAHWIKGPPMVQTLIWGSLLGPGLVTRNPYAGMWLLLLLVTLNHNLPSALGLGIAIGAAHGTARALGVLSNRKRMDTHCAPILILGTQWRWQFVDGLTLLLAASALAAYVLSLLSIHL